MMSKKYIQATQLNGQAIYKFCSYIVLPVQVLIFVLKLATVGSSFISSLRLFHNKLPLNESDSMPNFIVLVIGNLHKCLVLRSY